VETKTKGSSSEAVALITKKEVPMGRGDRARVRWAHDRERKKKAAERRKAAEAGKARKAAGKR
jgi:hypothetical protein